VVQGVGAKGKEKWFLEKKKKYILCVQNFEIVEPQNRKSNN
jgi:hypothetical protein